MKPAAKEFRSRSFFRGVVCFILLLVLPIALFAGSFWRSAGDLSEEALRLFRLRFAVCAAFSLLSGGSLSYYLAVRRCRPIRMIEGLFCSQAENPPKGEDEIASLVRQIQELQERDLRSEEKLAGREEQLRQAIAAAHHGERPPKCVDPADLCDQEEEELPTAANRTESIVGRVKTYIDENYADMNLSVTMIAEENGVSPSYLAQIFKKKTGHSTADYIHATRLKNAKLLLNSCRVKDIAEMVGYQDVRSLIRVFKKYEGATPTQFRGDENGERSKL